jgi:2-polyprenyl-3-methyl-5-hydroxy-6-metoxy-1,4-benzoquinol methylase
MNFAQRSLKKELLDGENIPFADIRRNMEELDGINHRLGGHAITLRGLRSLLKGRTVGEPVRVLEIGCGGGDNLRVIGSWAARKGLAVELTGVDINAACVAFAKDQSRNRGIDFICSDYRDYAPPRAPHIIFSSLFCHHFTDPELVEMLQWMKERAEVGFFINDLHRHPLAYHSIRLLTKAFSRSYLVRNDAPLSVLRGFRREEWGTLLQQASIASYQLQWQWAFRWLLVVPNQK